MRGVTTVSSSAISSFVFQPALPMRGVTLSLSEIDEVTKFQPALPMRGVTLRDWQQYHKYYHFNPHSPCGE